MAEATHSTVDPAEVERFQRIAAEWWDPNGKLAPLHRLNPVRLGYIRDRAAAHWRRQPLGGAPVQGLTLLDIGCGGGLLCEPMTRLGADVTGIDAAPGNLATARLHAEGQGLAIDYRQTTAEMLAESGAQYDIVLALEVVEHVADVALFLKSCGRLVKPGGLLFLSTLNRTTKAWLLAIAGAEYVLRWLPRGTHDWRKFVKPSEATRGLSDGGVEVQEIVGVVYSSISRAWSLKASDLDVNYMLFGTKPL